MPPSASRTGAHTKHGALGGGSQREELHALGVWTHLAFLLPSLPSFCGIFDTIYSKPVLINTSGFSLPEWPPNFVEYCLTKNFHLQLCLLATIIKHLYLLLLLLFKIMAVTLFFVIELFV